MAKMNVHSGVLVSPGYRNGSAEYTFNSKDILWDGRVGYSNSTCCSLHNPPYFTEPLSQTTDDLELRMCLNNIATYDNITLELVELLCM